MNTWNLITEWLLTNNWFTPMNKQLARNIWPLDAIYIWELVRQRKKFKQDEFYFSQKELMEEISIPLHNQTQILKKAEGINLISVNKKGLPCKNWYKINNDLVIKLSTETVDIGSMFSEEYVSWLLARQNRNKTKDADGTFLTINKKRIIRKEYNSCASSLKTLEFSDLVWVPKEKINLEIKPREGEKEKNSEKKERLDKLNNYGLGEKLISDWEIPTTQVDQARIILYIYNTLKTKWKIRAEDTFLKKIYKQFKKWVEYTDIINAIWTLNFNKFCNWEAWWRWWVWWIDYLCDARWIDKAWTYKIDKSDTETSIILRDKLKYILTLPSEFKSTKSVNKWVLEESNLTEQQKKQIQSNTVVF